MTSKTPISSAARSQSPARAQAAGPREEVHALVGHLTTSWSNNESLFIFVVMLLLETDEVRAAIVFATLNTTRARLDLVQRLATVRVVDRGLRSELDRVIKRFLKQTRLRNEINHAIYAVDERGALVEARLMKLEESRSGLAFGRRIALDENWRQRVRDALTDAAELNREIWSLLPRIEAHLEARPVPKSRVQDRGQARDGKSDNTTIES